MATAAHTQVYLLVAGHGDVAQAQLMTAEQATAANSLRVEGNPWRWVSVGTPDLLFAAPDLLAAAERAADVLDKHAHPFNHEYSAAAALRKAIAKAAIAKSSR